MRIYYVDMKLLVILAILSLCCSEDLPNKHVKRSYVCPPKFIRQGHRCYFFSKEALTWQEAMFRCRNLRGNLVVIKRANQDKLIKNFLIKKTVASLERWIGATYDWEGMKWKWAASGKDLAYSGFQTTFKEDTDKLKWQCAVMDPSLSYRWSARQCTEKKHFICHTKIKTVTNRDKKKLAKQYNVNKYNKLNEIPVPTIPEYGNSTPSLKANAPVNYSLNDQAILRATNPREQLKRVKKHRNKPKKKTIRYRNGTVVETPKRKTKKYKLDKIEWTTYKKKDNLTNPYYPRPIVMEYNIEK